MPPSLPVRSILRMSSLVGYTTNSLPVTRCSSWSLSVLARTLRQHSAVSDMNVETIRQILCEAGASYHLGEAMESAVWPMHSCMPGSPICYKLQ
jgi:hypothetical protein